jgi:Protein of unknown function (DUF998)
MEVLGLSRLSQDADDLEQARRVAAGAVGVVGVAAYNWWVVVPFIPRLLPSVNGFFSDLEATGRPHADLMADADMVAGVLLVAALVVRGARVDGRPRPEWRWMVAFAAAGAIGGRFTYACSEGLSAACRAAEWHFRLPPHHYIHVVSGIAEFATLTVAAVLAAQRTRGERSVWSRAYLGVVVTLLAAYPLLAAVYLTDRYGALVEPVFFIAFSVMVLVELLEPAHRETVGDHPTPDGTVGPPAVQEHDVAMPRGTD